MMFAIYAASIVFPYREDWRREEARDAGDSFLS